MKRKIILGLLSLVALTVVVFVIFGTMTCNQEKKIEKLEANIQHLKTVHTPLRFKITERTDTYFKVAVKYYDADNEVIKRIEQKFKGSELSLDFLEFKFADKYIAFPFKMYSDAIAPDSGYVMLNDYDKAGFPQIFKSKGMNPDLSKGIQILFEDVKENKLNPQAIYFGNMVHDLKGIKSYRTDVVYKILIHTKGGIEVTED